MSKKKLFQPPLPGQENHIASVGGHVWSTTYVYATGYKKAADILVDHAEGRMGDFLFSPLYFNYRQFAELSLKYLIRRAEEVWDLCVRCHLATGQLSERVTEKLEDTHSIYRLQEWLAKRLWLLTKERFDPDVHQILVELHNLDPKSQVSRYPYRKKDRKPSMEAQEIIDLLNVKQKMQDVADYLDRIDAMLDTMTEALTEGVRW